MTTASVSSSRAGSPDVPAAAAPATAAPGTGVDALAGLPLVLDRELLAVRRHDLELAGRVPERLPVVVDDAVGLIPLGRPGEVDEVAAAVAYLVREDSRFVTGQVLSVNGGSSMG